MEQITVEQAYRAMLCLLQDILRRGNVDVEWLFFSYAGLLTDGCPADPAAWDDWLKAIEDAKRGEPGPMNTDLLARRSSAAREGGAQT